MLKPITLFIAGFIVGGIVMFIITYDPGTEYKIAVGNFVLQKSISQNSPFAKCRQQQSGLETLIASQAADLSRVSGEVFELQKQAANTAAQFTKEGIFRVPYAAQVNRCEAMHSDTEVNYNHPSPRCSSLLDEQLRNVEDKKREYAELQKAKAQKSAELDRLEQECFGLKKADLP